MPLRSLGSSGAMAIGRVRGTKAARWPSRRCSREGTRARRLDGLVVDAGALYARRTRSTPDHRRGQRPATSSTEREELITRRELAIAAADYLIPGSRWADAQAAFLEDLVEGTFMVEMPRSATAARRPETSIARAIADLPARPRATPRSSCCPRFDPRRILSFDERAFRAVAPLQGGSFTVLPADR